MLQFGMPTLIETTTVDACAGLCIELGMSFIELNMNLPAYQAERMDIQKLRAVAERHGIYYTIHLDENLNPCDFNRRVAEAYTRTTMEAISIAGQLGAPVLNMHLSKGVYFTLPDRKVYLFEQYREEYLRGITRFRELCGSAAQNAGVTVCIENTSGYTGFQLEAINQLLEHPAFGLTYDVGHDHASGGSDRAVMLERADRLRHMHLHDALPGRDHLTLGTGELDIHDRLHLAAEHGCRVVVETKTVDGLRRSLEWLRSCGYQDS